MSRQCHAIRASEIQSRLLFASVEQYPYQIKSRITNHKLILERQIGRTARQQTMYLTASSESHYLMLYGSASQSPYGSVQTLFTKIGCASCGVRIPNNSILGHSTIPLTYSQTEPGKPRPYCSLSGVKPACFGHGCHFPTLELGCDYGDYERTNELLRLC